MNIVTSFATEVSKLKDQGIRFSGLSAGQQQKVLDLIGVYLGSIPNDQALTRMGEIEEEGLNEIRFAWAGATQKDKPHYYRIQGPSFLIEFDNVFGDANHVHTVWRDFDGDFGLDLLKEHYDAQH